MSTPSVNYTAAGTQFSIPASETEQTDITAFLINALQAIEDHTHAATHGLAVTRLGDTITAQSDSAGAIGVLLTTLHNSASPAANDTIFRLVVTGKDSGANTTTYAQADVFIQDPVDGTEDAYFVFKTMQAGTLSNALLLSGGGSGLVNRLYGGGLTIDAGGFVVTAGDVTLAGAALATNATSGFTNVPSCAGPPTGAYTPPTGTVALVYDSTNNKLYSRNGGTWRSTAAFT